MSSVNESSVECPHCGARTGTESGFCDECGIELGSQAIKPITVAQLMAAGVPGEEAVITASVCPNCGHQLRPGARHCPNCGKKIPKTAAQSTRVPAQPVINSEGAESALQNGLVIAGRYKLESILGQGGMGRVWRAYDQHLNKDVVVKTVLTPDDNLRSALQKEAEVLINIRHPNIVAVIDFFTVDKELCYVMEFVSGPSWADEIEEPETRRLVLPMSAEQALGKVKALLPAFQYLHGLNPPIIYCDFKPANVQSMKLPNGETIEVLLDFGAAYLYDPAVPPKPARGTPGYHSPSAMHPDWRDDYFTIGRTIAELIGMSEVHNAAYKYSLTAADEAPWRHYDDSLRYFVEWLTAPAREDRPQSVEAIIEELDGVLGYVKGQRPGLRTATTQRKPVTFAGVSVETMRSTTILGTAQVDFPEAPSANPAAAILTSAHEAYQQRSFSRALLLANQAVNNNGGAPAYVLRSLIHNQLGNVSEAQADLAQAQHLSDPQVQWEMMLAEGQLLENAGQFDQAAERYRRMMALKPGDHRGRLLLADLYRRSGNHAQAIAEYRAIIKSKPHVGLAYVGASKAYLGNQQRDNAIKVLEEVSSRNASYNDVLIELIDLYHQKAAHGDRDSLELAARAIDALRQNGVDTVPFLLLIAEFYYTAFTIAQKTRSIPALTWPDNRKFAKLADLAKANEQAWRDYLARGAHANRDEIVNKRIMNRRTWAVL